MKKILLFLLVPISVGAQVSPDFNSGEFKVGYPCEALDKISKEKEEHELITFYEKDKNPFLVAGYILRKRTDNKGKSDYTIKYRKESSSLLLDEKLYKDLSASTQGELKCEYDVTYHHIQPKVVRSCSFKSMTAGPLSLHRDFVKMIGSPIPEFTDMKEFRVEATSWKLKLSEEALKTNPFKKAPSVERWMTRGECRLEVSGKMDFLSRDLSYIHEVSARNFKFLKDAVKAAPLSQQGNKTEWVLGLR